MAFARNERVAELLRNATAFKDKKDWDAALAALAEGKKRMLVSPVAYPAETWCKSPLYLQQAGRFDEAMAEFQFLLDDLDRRARRDANVDDPGVGSKRDRLAYYKRLVQNDRRTINEKLALAKSREEKRLVKLAQKDRS